MSYDGKKLQVLKSHLPDYLCRWLNHVRSPVPIVPYSFAYTIVFIFNALVVASINLCRRNCHKRVVLHVVHRLTRLELSSSEPILQQILSQEKPAWLLRRFQLALGDASLLGFEWESTSTTATPLATSRVWWTATAKHEPLPQRVDFDCMYVACDCELLKGSFDSWYDTESLGYIAKIVGCHWAGPDV